MTARPASPYRGRSRPPRPFTAPWPLALGGAAIAAQGAVLLLRPRTGLIAADPVAVEEHFSPDEIARARAFGRPQLALHAASGLVQAGILAALARRLPSPPDPRRRRPSLRLRGRRRERPLIEAAAMGAALSAGVGLAPLPLSVIARRRALAVGLATQSWGGWAGDVAKSTVLGSGLSGAGAVAAVTLMRRRPRLWWLPASAAAVAGGTLFSFLAPVVLDPLFNRFRPLPAGDIRADVMELAQRAGVSVGEVYEVDASRRTTAANAYVAGLGATKRVVVFDTLLEKFSREEARLVVAHELAHVRHRDLLRGLVHMALVAPAALHAVAALVPVLSGPRREPAGAQTLPPLALALGIVSAVTGVISSQLSRRIESRADAFSLRLTGASEPFISFERRIVAQNLADPDPPRWLTLLIGSHPSAVERIGTARAYARGVR